MSLRILLGIIFLLSGAGKLIDDSSTRYLVELMASEFYWLIEYSTAIIVTTSLIELFLAGLLFWGKKLTFAYSLSIAMFLFFTAVLGYFYIQGLSIADCGCFGAFGLTTSLEFTLIRNILLTLLATAGLMVTLIKPRRA